MFAPLAIACTLLSTAYHGFGVANTRIELAAKRALPLLAKAAQGHRENRSCFACHNQSLAMLAYVTAQKKGLSDSNFYLEDQAEFIAAFLEGNRENYTKGKGQGGQVDTAGYALFTLELAKWQADETTGAMVEYLLLFQADLPSWKATSNRPPSEVSSFTTTYFALRALRKWGKPEQKDRIDKRIAQVRDWLVKTPAKDTEDRVFRLWSLKEAQASKTDLQSAAWELASAQREDGGWGQTDKMPSDAYATGSALVALHDAMGLAPTLPMYRRGLTFLVQSQHADGSWKVVSRSKPFQIYFESGFPHGKDQFISAAATGWAATALLLALDSPAPKPPAGAKNRETNP